MIALGEAAKLHLGERLPVGRIGAEAANPGRMVEDEHASHVADAVAAHLVDLARVAVINCDDTPRSSHAPPPRELVPPSHSWPPSAEFLPALKGLHTQ